MKIFISWSGNRSKAVAEVISDWLKCVIQASKPWISTRDIDRGAIWFSEISDKLKDTSVGVVCLTQENKNKPWILFETGALAKGLTTNRVCTFLIDLEPSDLQDPLAQFNHTKPDRNSVWELSRTINDSLGDKALDERILEQVFETYWPQFESGFKEALEQNPPGETVPPRPENEILDEILQNTRSLNHRVRGLESMNYSDKRHSERMNLSKIDFDKRVRSRILKMMQSGKYSEDEIVSAIIDYDMPEDYAKKLVRNFQLEWGRSDKERIASKS